MFTSHENHLRKIRMRRLHRLTDYSRQRASWQWGECRSTVGATHGSPMSVAACFRFPNACCCCVRVYCSIWPDTYRHWFPLCNDVLPLTYSTLRSATCILMTKRTLRLLLPRLLLLCFFLSHSFISSFASISLIHISRHIASPYIHISIDLRHKSFRWGLSC